MMDDNLSTYLEWKRKEKKERKKERERVTPGWTDISGPGPVNFLSRSSIYYNMLILHKPLNVISTNSFSLASNFTSPITWCTDELRRLELIQ